MKSKPFFEGDPYFTASHFAGNSFFQDFSDKSWEDILQFFDPKHFTDDVNFVSYRQLIANLKWIREQHILDLPKEDHNTYVSATTSTSTTTASLDTTLTASPSSLSHCDFLLLNLPKDFLISKDYSFCISKSYLCTLLQVYSWYAQKYDSSHSLLTSHQVDLTTNASRIRKFLDILHSSKDQSPFFIETFKKRLLSLLPFLVYTILDEIVAHLEIPEGIDSPQQLNLLRHFFFIPSITVSSVNFFGMDNDNDIEVTINLAKSTNDSSATLIPMDFFPFEVDFYPDYSQLNIFLDGLLKIFLLDSTSSIDFADLTRKENLDTKEKDSTLNHLFLISSTIFPFHSFEWHDFLSWKEMNPTERLEYLQQYRSSKGKALYKSELRDHYLSSSFFFFLPPSSQDSLSKATSLASTYQFSSFYQLFQSISNQATVGNPSSTCTTQFPIQDDSDCLQLLEDIISVSNSTFSLQDPFIPSIMGCFPKTLNAILSLKKPDYYSPDQSLYEDFPAIQGIRFTATPRPDTTISSFSTTRRSTYEVFLWFLITMSFWKDVYISQSSLAMPLKLKTAFQENNLIASFPYLQVKDQLIYAFNLGMDGEKEFSFNINLAALISSQLVRECTDSTFKKHVLFE